MTEIGNPGRSPGSGPGDTAKDARQPGEAGGTRQRPAARTLLRSSALREMLSAEATLEAEWSALKRSGYGYRELREGLAAAATSDAEPLAFLRAAEPVQRAFLAHLDAFQGRQHAHVMEQVIAELEHAMKTMDAFYGRRRVRGVFRRFRRLRGLAQRCRELEPLYGTAADHRRIATHQRFYAQVLAFSERIRRLDPTMPPSAAPSLVDRIYRLRRHGLVSRFRALGRLVRAAFGILWSVFTREPSEAGTPFTNRVDALFRAWGELHGYEVVVEGAEWLPRGDDPQGVRLFTPAHRHGVTDNVTFSHLGLDDYLVFNAVDQLPLLPRALKDRVADTRGLIAVGGGRGPSVDRALEALTTGVSRNILIYPEGSVSEGLGGTRPVRENFGEGLVRRIRAAGYALTLVPLTYPDNARFLDLPARSAGPLDRRRRVVVSPPLETPMLDAVLAAGGGGQLNRLLRLAWLEQLDSDDRRFLGLERVAEIERRLDAELDGIRYWGSVESAPVEDLLRASSGDPVQIREEPFRGMRVRVLQFPTNAADERGRISLENLLDADSNELIIGIRAPSHIYLQLGPKRFDGDIFRPLSLKERSYVYAGGILVRFMDVPVKSLNAIRRKLEEFVGREQRTLTCANSACKVIGRAANIRIDDHADMRPFLPSHVIPTRTIRKLIERGVRNHSGGRVECQVYKTDPRSLETILAEMRQAEIRIARDHLSMLTRVTWGAVRSSARRIAGG